VPLRETLGVIVFQDQVLDVAIHLAGFTVGEAEGLRRAMSRKRSLAALEAYRERFIAGAIGKGVDEQVAHSVYDKLVAFSGFGFPKSHSAAFGLLAYQSAWLRHHYRAEFLASLLNAQPMGFYSPQSLVHDARRHGIEIRNGLDQQYRAVASGHWPLIRYDPLVRTAGGNPFLLDSPRPRMPLASYTQRELRYRSLSNTNPAEAERLGVLAQEAVDQRWETYEEMATRSAHRFPADARKER